MIERDDVTVYKLVGTGVETISAVNLSSDYKQTSVTTSTNGDGTVLFGSATYGETVNSAKVFSFYNVNHMELVSNAAVLAKVMDLITASTNVIAE